MRRKRDTEPPWVTAGMSRATWYRHGKPQTKPSHQITLTDAAKLYDVGVRSVQRAARIARYAPDLAEQVKAGKLTHGEAEHMLIARQDKALLEGSADERAVAAVRKRRERQARRLL